MGSGSQDSITRLVRRRARNKAALVLFGRTVVSTLAIVSGWLGFLTGVRLQSSNYDPYAYATGVGALFAAACAVIAFMPWMYWSPNLQIDTMKHAGTRSCDRVFFPLKKMAKR